MSGRPRIAVLDYEIGNLRSAEKGLQRMGADAHLTADEDEIRAAAGVVLPGVGAFGRCMAALEQRGLDRMARAVIDAGTPFLGICIGMQLLYEGSEESPDIAGLGVLSGTVRLLPASVKRPQMQWNLVERQRPTTVLEGLGDPLWAYFNHSYAAPVGAEVVATCDYGGPVPAVVERGNLWATQFHPEKSSERGLALLANFIRAASLHRVG